MVQVPPQAICRGNHPRHTSVRAKIVWEVIHWNSRTQPTLRRARLWEWMRHRQEDMRLKPLNTSPLEMISLQSSVYTF